MLRRVGSNESAAAFFPGSAPGTQIVPCVFTGTQDVISRTDNELGRGFSIPELDRLDIQATGANLITGDNHAIWYTKTGSTTFTREAGQRKKRTGIIAALIAALHGFFHRKTRVW